MNAEEQIIESLGAINKRLDQVGSFEKRLETVVTDIKLLKETDEERRKGLDEVQQKVLAFSKARIKAATLSSGVSLRGNRLTEECAAHLCGVYMLAALRQDTEGRLQARQRDFFHGEIKNILGLDTKASLTSSDIPLPTEFSGQIVELVSQ